MLVVLGMAVLLSLGGPTILAQSTTTGTVAGQVMDQQNQPLMGAQVSLRDNATNTVLKTVSNEAGRYAFINISPGLYDITVSMDNFKTARITGQKVTVGLALTVNILMEIGSVAESVTVTSGAVTELQTMNSAVGTTLSRESLEHLPNLGRDVTTLAVLQPGTTPGGFTAGSYSDQNTYTIDGGNNTDDMAGNVTSYITNFTGIGGSQTNGTVSGVLMTPIESIEEFKVNTFNQSADFNSSIGGQVAMVTKRGTNQFHGAAYMFYYATNIGAANSWKNDHTPSTTSDGTKLGYTPIVPNHRSRFGGALGGPITPEILGGKTYLFVNYEGSRFPNSFNYERIVPSDLMRAGVIQVPDATGKYVAYNLNPNPVTVNGVTYQPAQCPNSPNGMCDPRAVGLNPVVNQIWTKFMPRANDPLFGGGDNFNTQGYLSTIRAPLTSDFHVARLDHDFGSKWRFFTSWRAQHINNVTTNQVDLGGALPGDTFGQPAATAPRPQVAELLVAGMTTTISPHTTNDFRFSYQYNWWQWSSGNAPAQIPGLGGALEIGGESTSALIPYNVNTQNVRQRIWDGQDKMFRDDVTMLKGNHLFQFGGLYQRNYDFHSRTDNGQGVNNQIVYQSTSSGINFTNSPFIPSSVPSSQQSLYRTLYSEVLGLVSLPQVVYTRTGNDLTLQPVGSSAFDRSIVPYYNVYFSDTWRMKPTLTLTYGLGYSLEMPPYELDGKQVALVDSGGNLVSTADYFAQRKKAALAGQVYNPTLGFELVRNVGSGLKYPYKPYYGGFSPRLSAAWNPNYSSGLLGKALGQGKTVIRGGFGIIYGRVNGVGQVLTPLLGVGLLQSVSCPGASMAGQCLGANKVDPSTVFRIGTDGMTAPLPPVSPTLAQPFLSGVNGNAVAADATVIDPNYKPEKTYNFDLTIQRQLSNKMSIEVGYIGRIIKNEFQEFNLDAVPYMTTLGGQTFANAYAALYTSLNAGASPASIARQPFFETALGGPTSPYCSGFSSCTAAVAANQRTTILNTAVSELWASLNSANGWILGRTMLSSNPAQATSISTDATLGYGNYNALFATVRMRDWHGLSGISNFTWGRALGTAALAQLNSSNTALDPFNISANYGPQNFDIKLLFNFALYYQLPFFKGKKGFLGHALAGWTVAPLFTAQSGNGNSVTYSEGSCTGCEAFGEVTPPAASTSTAENAVFAAPYTGGNSAHQGVTGSNGVGTSNPEGLNMFSDPAAVISEFRKCVLGIDTSCGGYYMMRGLPRWNLDATLSKEFTFTERIGATFSFQFTNVLNHFQPGDPSLSLTSPTQFGRITTQANTPRQLEFGLRLHF
ncbi:MAG: carboxypeptidase regulatory-like domain-containing protein [Blastocatellia bacterium]|nr:carboxypeptidase regulatory-like domain-containing protein [Blastocatellia bacterium]